MCYFYSNSTVYHSAWRIIQQPSLNMLGKVFRRLCLAALPLLPSSCHWITEPWFGFCFFHIASLNSHYMCFVTLKLRVLFRMSSHWSACWWSACSLDHISYSPHLLSLSSVFIASLRGGPKWRSRLICTLAWKRVFTICPVTKLLTVASLCFRLCVFLDWIVYAFCDQTIWIIYLVPFFSWTTAKLLVSVHQDHTESYQAWPAQFHMHLQAELSDCQATSSKYRW